MEFFLVGIAGYLIGSIPSGLMIGNVFYQVDLREHGSKNIGATNAYRTLGRVPAAAIFIADLLKGMACVWLGGYFIGAPLALVIGGIAAIVGHNWSIFLRFTGGKGVATGLGVIAMLMPSTTLLVFLVWAVIVYSTKYVSLGSVVGAALVPVSAYLSGEPIEYLLFGVLAAAFIIYRHKANIGRLLNGTESKIKAGHLNK